MWIFTIFIKTLVVASNLCAAKDQWNFIFWWCVVRVLWRPIARRTGLTQSHSSFTAWRYHTQIPLGTFYKNVKSVICITGNLSFCLKVNSAVCFWFEKWIQVHTDSCEIQVIQFNNEEDIFIPVIYVYKLTKWTVKTISLAEGTCRSSFPPHWWSQTIRQYLCGVCCFRSKTGNSFWSLITEAPVPAVPIQSQLILSFRPRKEKNIWKYDNNSVHLLTLNDAAVLWRLRFQTPTPLSTTSHYFLSQPPFLNCYESSACDDSEVIVCMEFSDAGEWKELLIPFRSCG